MQLKNSAGITLERRSFPLEIASVEQTGKLKGYGSVFGNVDSYKERIAPGAFADSLAAHAKAGTMPAMLWQHYSDQVPGVWESMVEDKKGLKVEGDFILETQLGKEAHILTSKKAVNGLSIGFVTRKSERDDDSGVRTLTAIDLWEVSIVTFPANTKARITDVKGLPTSIREFEDLLRDVGFSASHAKAIAVAGFKAADKARDESVGLAEVQAIIQRNTQLLKGRT